jgi:methyl-accepting chemotaxis protein
MDQGHRSQCGAAAAWKVSDPAHQKQFETEMAASSARATEIQNDIGKSELNAQEQALYQEVLSTRKAYTEVRKEVFKAKNAGDLELGKRLYEGDMAVKRDVYGIAEKSWSCWKPDCSMKRRRRSARATKTAVCC